MVIDIDRDISEGEWFPFQESIVDEKGKAIFEEPKKDAGRVRVRSVAPFMEERLLKRRRYDWVFNPNPEINDMVRKAYYEDLPLEEAKKENEDMFDFAITGLENFFDKNGKEIECTRENKIKLMKVPAFDRFIARCIRLVGSAQAEAKESEQKN